MYNILICDDDRDIVAALKIYLTSPEYRLFEAYDGMEALKAVQDEDIHLILLDIMMPVMDGMTAAVRLREITNAPIIFISAKSQDSDKILGLNVGGDDYITKPFNPLEVAARVNSQIRRYFRLGGTSTPKNRLEVGGIELYDDEKRVLRDGEELQMTPTEYEILKLLMSYPGRVFSPDEIYSAINKDSYGAKNAVAVHIRHLREKIEISPAEPRYLKIVWGKGYKIEKGTKK